MYWIMNSLASLAALTRVSVPTTGRANASMTMNVSPSSFPCIKPMISYCPPDLACMTCRVGIARQLEKQCAERQKAGRGTDHFDEGDGRDPDFFEVVRVLLPRAGVQDCFLFILVVLVNLVRLRMERVARQGGAEWSLVSESSRDLGAEHSDAAHLLNVVGEGEGRLSDLLG